MCTGNLVCVMTQVNTSFFFYIFLKFTYCINCIVLYGVNISLIYTLTNNFTFHYMFIKTWFSVFVKLFSSRGLLASPHNEGDFIFYYPRGDIWSLQCRYIMTHTHPLFFFMFTVSLSLSVGAALIRYTLQWFTTSCTAVLSGSIQEIQKTHSMQCRHNPVKHTHTQLNPLHNTAAWQTWTNGKWGELEVLIQYKWI